MMFTIKRTQLFDDWLKTLKDAQARGA
nr:type II toxin-antitoxin system RelE/ParE family toxin [Vibrio anguillarum]